MAVPEKRVWLSVSGSDAQNCHACGDYGGDGEVFIHTNGSGFRFQKKGLTWQLVSGANKVIALSEGRTPVGTKWKQEGKTGSSVQFIMSVRHVEMQKKFTGTVTSARKRITTPVSTGLNSVDGDESKVPIKFRESVRTERDRKLEQFSAYNDSLAEILELANAEKPSALQSWRELTAQLKAEEIKVQALQTQKQMAEQSANSLVQRLQQVQELHEEALAREKKLKQQLDALKEHHKGNASLQQKRVEQLEIELAQARKELAEQGANAAQQGAIAAEQRAYSAEQRAKAAQQGANAAEQRAYSAEQRATAAQQGAIAAEQRANTLVQSMQQVQELHEEALAREKKLKQQLDALKEQHKANASLQQKRMEQVEGELAQARKELSTLNGQENMLNREQELSKSLKGQLVRLQAELKTTQDALVNLRAEHDEVKEMLRVTTGNVRVLSSDLNVAQAELTAAEKKTSQTEQQLEVERQQRKQEQEAAAAALAKVKTQLDTALAKLSAKQKELHDSQQALQDALANSADLQIQLNEEQASHLRTLEDFRTVSSERDEARSKLRTLEGDCRYLQNELQAAESSFTIIQAKLEGEKAEHQANLQAVQDKAKSAVSTLQAQLEEEAKKHLQELRENQDNMQGLIEARDKAKQHAEALLKRSGQNHIKRDWERLKGGGHFPAGADLREGFTAAFLNFESFACDAIFALENLGHSETVAADVFVAQVMSPLYAGCKGYVDAQLQKYRDLMLTEFGMEVPADLTNDTVPKLFWFKSMQERLPREIKVLTNEQITDLLVRVDREENGMILAVHARMLEDSESGAISSSDSDLRLPQLARTLLMLFIHAALSDPNCFLLPEPGASLSYHNERCKEILSPGAKNHGLIKEGAKVQVVLPGLYFDDGTGTGVTSLVVPSLVRRTVSTAAAVVAPKTGTAPVKASGAAPAPPPPPFAEGASTASSRGAGPFTHPSAAGAGAPSSSPRTAVPAAQWDEVVLPPTPAPLLHTKNAGDYELD